ncbi:MAG: RNA methyltransferase [Bdellovibrionales bacterium]|nr:RNA methyltransferase [Bdellovibrionales bacterium]
MMSKIEIITSTTNSKYKTWLSLLQSKGIRQEGKYLLSGKTVVLDALKNHRSHINCILSVKDSSSISVDPEIQSFQLSQDLFNNLDVFGTDHPILVVNTPTILNYEDLKESGITVYIPVGDPSNLGAMIRSCNAFGVTNIVLLKEAANPFLPKSVRAASGNLFSICFYQGPSIHDLKTDAKNIYALDMNGEDLRNLSTQKNIRLLVGEEGPGIPDYSFKKISIPIHTDCESLNASVALGIALYELKTNVSK